MSKKKNPYRKWHKFVPGGQDWRGLDPKAKELCCAVFRSVTGQIPETLTDEELLEGVFMLIDADLLHIQFRMRDQGRIEVKTYFPFADDPQEAMNRLGIGVLH